MASANDCHDLYFFGEGHIQNNPRQVSIMGYEGERPVFIQFVTLPTQTSTQTRVSSHLNALLTAQPNQAFLVSAGLSGSNRGCNL